MSTPLRLNSSYCWRAGMAACTRASDFGKESGQIAKRCFYSGISRRSQPHFSGHAALT